MSPYGITTVLLGSHDDAKARVVRALKDEGFGVLTEIDVQATLRAKIGEEIEPYEILGACSPGLAHRALSVDRGIGMLLPCNVVLRDVEDGVEVSAADPEAMFSVVEPEVRRRLEGVVDEARTRLARALEALT